MAALRGLRKAQSHALVGALMGKKGAAQQPPASAGAPAAKKRAAPDDGAHIDALFAQLPKRTHSRPGPAGGGAPAAGAGAPPTKAQRQVGGGRQAGGPRGDSRPRTGPGSAKERAHFLDTGERLVPVRCVYCATHARRVSSVLVVDTPTESCC